MLKRLTVGQKIFSSFVIVAILFGGVSFESLKALNTSSEGFTTYRNYARESNLISEIQVTLLEATTCVKDFIITDKNEYKEKHFANIQKLLHLIDSAEKSFSTQDRISKILDVKQMIDVYEESFTEVARSQTLRSTLATNELIPKGDLMENYFGQIINSLGKSEKNSKALFWCARGIRHLVLGRLYAAKFLGDSDNDHIKKSLKEMAELDTITSQLSQILEAGNRKKLDEIINTSKSYIQILLQFTTLTEKRNDLIDSELDKLGPKMEAAIKQAKDSVIADQDKLGPELQARNTSAKTNVYLAGLCAILLGGISAIIIGRNITIPLKKVVNAAYKIAEGDMPEGIDDTDRTDELGLLSKAFNKMAASLKIMTEAMERIADSDLTLEVTPRSEHDTIGKALARMVENLKDDNRKIHDTVSILSSSLSQISAASAELTASAAETASAVAETNATVEEVKQTAHLSNEKSRQVADVARKAVRTSQQGQKASEDAASGMMNIKLQMDTIATSIVKLAEQSQHIGDIIYVVNDLADQSNILAVNASIEASKAGEEGKGFTVVAREIRNLSDQSKQSVAQIQSILADIQKATSSAVMITEEGGKAVEVGANLSSQTGESILSLSAVINQSAQSSAQIAASSQEQLAGLDQVAVALGSIKQAGEQNLESSRQLEMAVRDLDMQAKSLQEMMDRVKL
ncbi:HAMP domain-containing methyl-accepting chemotaxis protein [Desulfovibrio gilichinskyi]|uniref:Methyl-accepting chemotaxis protein n=1 Tax=Desulfovibrio gilichinskyi TaxID=1519643 RepID=A0A1X7CXX6_9BACT|nr:methyl-accepting chemotaxis protein [Desulfovibrio gilichinskyi]SMF05135.1 Methyl-accepting chemotaxis protein [Desulfovibrio gilichinskyi]